MVSNSVFSAYDFKTHSKERELTAPNPVPWLKKCFFTSKQIQNLSVK